MTNAPSPRFLELVLANPWNSVVLDRMAEFALEDWWLTAGCIVQPIWNAAHGKPPDYGVIDYDIFYFEPDTSWDAEDKIIRAITRLFEDLPIAVQIRNQARVPLWYESKFGVVYPRVCRASDGIDRFLKKTTAIGVRKTDIDYCVYAPFGVELAMNGVLEPNPVLPVPEVYASKAKRWKELWPDLVIHPWPV